MKDYEDPDRCGSCGGKCCRLYAWHEFDQSLMCHFIDALGSGFFNVEDPGGKTPFFIPALAWATGADEYRENLEARGIDIGWCEWHHPETGCILDRDKRPSTCREYNCTPEVPVSIQVALEQIF